MYIELNDNEVSLLLDALNDLPDCEEVEVLREKILCAAIPEDDELFNS
jgi:hypothetical protein